MARVRGTGTIRRVKSGSGKQVKGSWQIVLSLGRDPVTGRMRQATRTVRGSKADAARERELFRSELESGLRVGADKVTFGQFAKQWMDGRKASGSYAPNTITMNNVLMRHLLRHLDGVALRDIDAATVQSLYTAFANDGMTTQAAAAARMLRQMLGDAVRLDIIMRNPCDKVRPPKPVKPTRNDSLDQDAAARLMDALASAEGAGICCGALSAPDSLTASLACATAARLALACGFRRGEVLGLSWRDVDFTSGTLRVRYSMDTQTGQLKQPKTASSIRDVTLDPHGMADLERWRLRQAEHLLQMGIRQDGDTAVITDPLSNRMTWHTLNRWWTAFRKRFGFDGLRFHALRHMHASWLVSSGLSITAVSARLGHSKASMTLDRYAHAQRSDDELAARIIGGIMSPDVSGNSHAVGM